MKVTITDNLETVSVTIPEPSPLPSIPIPVGNDFTVAGKSPVNGDIPLSAVDVGADPAGTAEALLTTNTNFVDFINAEMEI